MAPVVLDVKAVEWQTTLVIECLLDDDDGVVNREFSSLETDGPGDQFDPVLVADKLRTIADAMNEDPRFQKVLKDLKQAAAQEVVDQAFSNGVETLCQAHVSKGAEVAPEMQLIKASVAFGLYVKKSAPELKTQVQHALTNFLTRRVGSWVAKQGGWDKVQDVSSK
uniref:Bcl-2-like protein 15 n=1 Tax=Iconisemion striatum TaxID=60296 RepID=A0A1A7XV07_9TELE